MCILTYFLSIFNCFFRKFTNGYFGHSAKAHSVDGSAHSAAYVNHTAVLIFVHSAVIFQRALRCPERLDKWQTHLSAVGVTCCKKVVIFDIFHTCRHMSHCKTVRILVESEAFSPFAEDIIVSAVEGDAKVCRKILIL